MSTRSSRAARRRRRRRREQLTPSQIQLAKLNEKFRRANEAAEARKREQAATPPADPKKLARVIERAAKEEQMRRLIQREHRRLDAQAERDHERNVRYADMPMVGPAIWSRAPMMP